MLAESFEHLVEVQSLHLTEYPPGQLPLVHVLQPLEQEVQGSQTILQAGIVVAVHGPLHRLSQHLVTPQVKNEHGLVKATHGHKQLQEIGYFVLMGRQLAEDIEQFTDDLLMEDDVHETDRMVFEQRGHSLEALLSLLGQLL